MKKLITLFVVVFVSLNSFSQDVLVLRSGDEIKSKVLEVTTDQVKYKKWENIDGPTYSSLKSEIFMIKYQNGSKDIFKEQPPVVAPPAPVSNEDKEKNEAILKLSTFVRNKISSQIIRVDKFRKTNGEMTNIFGQTFYKVSFEVDIKFIANGWKIGNSLEGYWSNFKVYPSEPNLAASGQQYMYGTKFYPLNSFFTLGCVAEMTKTDNGYEVKSFSVKTITDHGIVADSQQSGSDTQKEQPKYESSELKTGHIGYFTNVLRNLKGEENKSKSSKWILAGEYESSYYTDANWAQPSIKKNLFYRRNYYTGYGQADFGKKDSIYKNDLLIVNKKDSLFMKIRFSNRIFLDTKNENGIWNGTAEYILSLQIADDNYTQYFLNTQEGIIKNSNVNKDIANMSEIPIKLGKEVLANLPDSKNLYLSFLIQDKKLKDAILEGFVIFQTK